MKRLLSGNEAIALGAGAAGITFAAAYPGTPSTEILENIAGLCPTIDAQWSVNEKVALETVIGASMAGARSLAAMKHVGVNVAADPLMTVAYTGVRGGLIIITADDPGMYSSQNEQDNRYYAKFAGIPLLEPSDSQEAYDMIRSAIEISEQFDTPVLVRITTRIAHSKTLVEIADDREESAEVGFRLEHEREKYVMIPAYARARHKLLEERLSKLCEFNDNSKLNKVFNGNHPFGVITSGIDFQYVREVVRDKVSILKLGMTYPLPERTIRSFSSGKEKLFVVESLEPFLEEQIEVMGFQVFGKDGLPRCGELTPEIISRSFSMVIPDIEAEKPSARIEIPELPPRLPVMCPGCGHRPVFSVLARKGYIVTGDIGCYTLAVLPPLQAMDSCVCMGASIGMASGVCAVADRAGEKKRIVGIIGDSTFIHSGITPLIDAVYNKRNTNIIILDNETTAMTGHQVHPGTGETLKGDETFRFDYVALCRAIGVANVASIEADNIKTIEKTIEEEFSKEGVSVVIVHQPCVQHVRGLFKNTVAFEQSLCMMCGVCLRLGCPALSERNEQVYLDTIICANCGQCVQVCPTKALHFLDKDSL